MFKDAVSLTVAALSVGYILFANPAHAATPPAAPEWVSIERPITDNPCQAGNNAEDASDPSLVCINGDRQRWLLLTTGEIHRLLTIHVSE